MQNRVTELFGIKYPIICGGMVWCGGWRLTSAVSNAGGLGLLGAGSMTPELLREHIVKCKNATDKPFGVNLPLLYSRIEEMVDVIIDNGVKIVFTSAGSPAKWTSKFKQHGITVVHVTASTTFALKAQSAGVDAVVVEGFEAGGHNGKEETTSMVLIPAVREKIDIPIIAAGGIVSGASMVAAMVLGADAVQIGTRFALSEESSASPKFKERVLNLEEGGTMLTMKRLGAVRMVKNDIYDRVVDAENRCATDDELRDIVGKGRAKLGIFDGDLDEGFLEIGQASSLVSKVESAEQIIASIIDEYNEIINGFKKI